MDNGFRVAARAKRVRSLQFMIYIRIVVDLAIEADPDVAVLVRKRLLPRAEVNDAEPPMTERGAPANMNPTFIGATVMQYSRHFSNDRLVYRSAIEIHEPTDAAHIG